MNENTGALLIEIYTDGAARGNPGPGGYGFLTVTKSLEDKIVSPVMAITTGNKEITNNQAEYFALIFALKSLKEGDHEIIIFSDSQLLVKQVKREWKVKDPILNILREKVYVELKRLNAPINIHHVPRSHPFITAVDREVNKVMDEKTLSPTQDEIHAEMEKIHSKYCR